MLITKNMVQEYLEYKNGHLYWKKLTSSKSRIKIGSRFGANDNGYIKGTILGKTAREHQLVFLLHNGYIPKLIDHIDQDRSNNSISNLRDTSYHTNRVNCKRNSNNTSGFKGVSFNKQYNKYETAINYNGKRKFLGRFDTAKEANTVYQNAAYSLHSP